MDSYNFRFFLEFALDWNLRQIQERETSVLVSG